VALPLLCKEFIITYQIYLARAVEHAVLLIAAIYRIKTFRTFENCSWGMNALVEVHTLAELDRAGAKRPAFRGLTVI